MYSFDRLFIFYGACEFPERNYILQRRANSEIQISQL